MGIGKNQQNGRRKRQGKNVKQDKHSTPIVIGLVIYLLSLLMLLLLYSYGVHIAAVQNIALTWGPLVVAVLTLLFGDNLKNTSMKYIIASVLIAVFLADASATHLHNSGFRMIIQTPSEIEETTPPGVEPITEVEATAKPFSPIDYPGDDEKKAIVDIDSNTDILAPETVILNANALSNEDIFTPTGGLDGLLDVISPKLKDLLPPIQASKKSEWEARISDTIKGTINTDSQPSNDVVNGNGEFAKLTRMANKTEIDLNENGMDSKKLFDMVNHREQAFDIYQTSGLRSRLANDYHRVARYYRFDEEWESSYKYYLKSIEFFLRHIRILSQAGDMYFKDLYQIAILYQCIGDIPVIQKEYRTQAYFLSTCFMEIVSKNTTAESMEEYGFLSSYYAGMINQKQALLGLYSGTTADIDVFIRDGIEYYKRSLGFENYKLQRSYQYEYLADLCQCAQNFLLKRSSSVLEPYTYYESKKDHYHSLATQYPVA